MTTAIDSVRENLNKSLYDDSKPWSGLLAWAEKTSGVKRIYLFIGGFSLVILFLLFLELDFHNLITLLNVRTTLTVTD